MDVDMKEKFMELLTGSGVTAEMGVTPVKFTYVLNCTRDDDVIDFWFLETDGAVDTKVPNFVKWNIEDYIFACVKDGDYENGKYIIGKTHDLEGYGTPEGVHADEALMTMSFAELADALK